ncbi:MAG: hypothetical protein AB7O98_15900 [Hyphomonadaceae bacterium]
MRRARRLSWALPLALALTAASEPQLLLREQVWTADSATLARDLIGAPGECLATLTPEIEAGRALFRSPVLLGGPAARAGLSCHACHENGRVNAHFLLPELTDRAGAADVTSEWSSRVRGDGRLNPLDIPDLAGVAQRTVLGRDRDPSLEHFVHGVIVEEFQGPEPPDAALRSLIAYLRALDSGACIEGAPVTLSSAADDVRRAVAAAEAMEDAATASLVLASAQDAIGRIAERLPARRFARERSTLAQLSRDLTGMRGDREALAAAAPGWRARFDAAIARIAPREHRTYFNEAMLRAALAR